MDYEFSNLSEHKSFFQTRARRKLLKRLVSLVIFFAVAQYIISKLGANRTDMLLSCILTWLVLGVRYND